MQKVTKKIHYLTTLLKAAFLLKSIEFKTHLDEKLMAFFFGFGEKAKVLVVIVPHIANVGHAVGISRGEANLIATLRFVGKQRQV